LNKKESCINRTLKSPNWRNLYQFNLHKIEHFMIFFCVHWDRMRGDCSFCWCWWNFLPSRFKLSFHYVDWSKARDVRRNPLPAKHINESRVIEDLLTWSQHKAMIKTNNDFSYHTCHLIIDIIVCEDQRENLLNHR
jgi:hypothetical protein